MTPETILGTLAAAALAVVAEYARRLRKRLSLVGKGIDDERQQRRISDAGRAGARVSEQHLAHELRKEREAHRRQLGASRSRFLAFVERLKARGILFGSEDDAHIDGVLQTMTERKR